MRLTGRCTMILVAAFVACIPLLLGVGGCGSRGRVDAKSIKTPLEGILKRHDAYVAADATLAPVERETFLRSSALVTTVLDTALAPPKSAAPTSPGVLSPLPVEDSEAPEGNPDSQ